MSLTLQFFDKDTPLTDLLSTAAHSRDFCSVRAEFVRSRLRFVSLLFSALAALWILVDYQYLSYERFVTIAPFMALLAVIFALLWAVATPQQTRLAYLLPLFFLFSLTFFFVSRLLLPGASLEQSMIIGYYFAPFLLVTLLSLFPMTIGESLAYQSSVLLAYLLAEFVIWRGESSVAIGHAWLLGMMVAMVMWAQLSQLQMLLRLYREASYDVLTGLVNRRVITKALQQCLQEAKQKKTPLAVLLLDLDYFKRINDQHGHICGDEVLRAFGQLLREQINSPQMAARFGGEEFLVILPDSTAEQAGQLAEAIRQACHSLHINGPDGEDVTLTVSIGVTHYQNGDDEKRLIKRVDDTLYSAKEAGRDLVAQV